MAIVNGSVSPTEYKISLEATTLSPTVTGTVTARTCSESWLSTSGNSIVVTKNNSFTYRQAMVKYFFADSTSGYTRVWQSGGTAPSLSTTAMTFTEKASTQDIIFTNNTTVTGTLKAVRFGGSDFFTATVEGNKIHVTITQNTTAASRSGGMQIQYTGSGWYKDVTVTQEAGKSITISPTSGNLPSAGGDLVVNVVDGYIRATDSSESWLTASKTDQYHGKVTGTVNLNGASRTGTVRFFGLGDSVAEYTVTQAASTAVLNLDKESLTFTAKQATSDTVKVVSTNLSLIAPTSSESWCTVAWDATNKIATVTCDNFVQIGGSSRTANITIGDGTYYKTVKVTQNPIVSINLNPSYKNAGPSAGRVEVSSNVPLTYVESTEDWFSAQQVSDKMFIVTWERNEHLTSETGSEREGYVMVSSSEMGTNFTMRQSGMTASISPESISVDDKERDTYITVTSNMTGGTVTASSSPAWITTTIEGMKVKVHTSQNPSTSPRSGQVIVHYGAFEQTVSVQQSGFVPEVLVSPTSIQFSSNEDTKYFTGTTNLSGDRWGILTDFGEVEITSESTTGQTITGRITVPANSGSTSLSGTCTLSYGGLSAQIALEQPGQIVMVSPSSVSFPASGGSASCTGITTITGNVWSVVEKSEWITAKITEGNNILIAVGENKRGQRVGIVKVRYADVVCEITVTQAATTHSYLDVESPVMTFPLSGGTQENNITAVNVSGITVSGVPAGYTATTSGDVLTVVAAAASKTKVVTFNLVGTSTIDRTTLTCLVRIVQIAEGEHLQVWKDEDLTFPTSSDYIDYDVLVDGYETIYTGRAYKMQDGDAIIFNINDIVENHLDSELDWDDIQESNGFYSSVSPKYSRMFLIKTGDNVIGTYRFFNSWSYDDIYQQPIKNNAVFISEPVSNVIDDRQFFICSVYGYNSLIPFNLNLDTGSTTLNGWQMKNITHFDLFPGTLNVNGQRYEVKRTKADYCIYYLNAWGGWDSLLVEGNTKRTDKITRYDSTKYASNQTINYRKENYTNIIEPSFKCYTGYLSDEASKRMHHLLESRKVYLFDLEKRDTLIPVILKNSNCEWKIYRNGCKLPQYEIELEYSHILKRK